MAIIRVERSDDSSYLCSRHGPLLARATDDDPADAVIVVHASEMDAELAAALARVATRVSEGHTARPGRNGIKAPPSYSITTFLLPADEIPGGELVYLEKRDSNIVVIYDESRVSPDLGERLAALVAGPSVAPTYNGHGIG
jgi:hypothetical protein